MHSAARFKHLFNLYLKDFISLAERWEFFELVATSSFDDIIETDMEKTFYNDGNDYAAGIEPHHNFLQPSHLINISKK